MSIFAMVSHGLPLQNPDHRKAWIHHMKITQIRNATLLIEVASHRVLVDPMLGRQGALPSLKYLGGQRRRNPIVELPDGIDAMLASATHALITHCQKGHFDHLDRAGKRWLRERRLPVLCMPDDAAYLRQRGLSVQLLNAGESTEALGGRITPVACLHGRGWIGKLMAHGHGYIMEWPGEPVLYLAGDTVLTDDVRRVVEALPSDSVCVLPAGGAAMDFGGELIMDVDQALRAAVAGRGRFVLNHLEALDHCPTRRSELRAEICSRGLDARVQVPDDGQTLVFALPPTCVH
jgi:L-ascorbate metabolism protein UlaG (beta-lactamase superfamily)